MKLILRLFLLITALALSSCVSSGSTITPTWTETQPSSPTFMLPASTPALQPTQTATLTAPATLEPEQAKETIRILLREPVDCEVPCFWGITPNQATLGEAQNFFNRLGLRLTQTVQKGEKVFYATSFGLENGVNTSIVLRVQNGLVDSTRTNIGFINYSGSSPLQDSKAFPSMMPKDLADIIRDLGMRSP